MLKNGKLPRILRGKEANMSKLKEYQVREIRSLENKMSGAAIARKYGVGKTCISNIIRGKSWIHIIDPVNVVGKNCIPISESIDLIKLYLKEKTEKVMSEEEMEKILVVELAGVCSVKQIKQILAALDKRSGYELFLRISGMC